jgi:serine/threonine protein kinase
MDGSGAISVSSDDTRLSEPDDSDRYKFVEKIGEGTFSDVWKVTDNFGASFAAKRMKKSYKW